MHWQLYLNFLVALLAIANPIGKIPLWIPASAGEDGATRLRLALLATLTGGGILLLFLLFGTAVLGFFGIDLASFRVAGGVVLLRVSIQMLDGDATRMNLGDDREQASRSRLAAAKARLRRVLVPLVVPFIAGPGSISTVVLFGARAGGPVDQAMLAAILGLVMALVFVVFMLGRRVQRLLGDLTLEVQTRLFGLVLAAVAMQLMLTGLGEAFPQWLPGPSPLADDVEQARESTGPGGS